MEEWRIIEGHEVSNLGNTKEKKRLNMGYEIICSGLGFPVHILVAKAFPEICGKWFKGCVVHHKDRNKLNNRADNLVVLSVSEHRREHIMEMVKKRAENNPNNEMWYKIAQIKKENGSIHNNKWKNIGMFSIDGELIKTYDELNDILKEHEGEEGYSSHNIRNVLKGRQKSAGGYIWKKL